MLCCDSDWTHKDIKANGVGEFKILGRAYEIIAGKPCPFPTCDGIIRTELIGGESQFTIEPTRSK